MGSKDASEGRSDRPSKDEIRALLARWAAGDEGALGELFPVYFKSIARLLKSEGHNFEDGEDLTQEVFARLHKWLQAGHPAPEKLTLYLLASARDLACRKGRRKKLPMEDGEPAKIPGLFASTRSILTTLGSLEVRNLLKEAIDRLPEPYKETYLLRMEGLVEREIAERLAVPVGTVKARLHRGLEILREDLDKIAREMSTWYAQRVKGELTPVALLQATQKIPWTYGDPLRLKHFERLADDVAAAKLGLTSDVFLARLARGYELMEAELGLSFPLAFDVLPKEAGAP